MPRSSRDQDRPSAVLSRDPFDVALHDLTGLPNGANAGPALIQHIDDYKFSTAYMVQSVRWDGGVTSFITITSAKGSDRFVLPPPVTALLLRQRESLTAQVRRRHGQRLAAERAANGAAVSRLHTPEARAKALKTRREKATRRQARRARKGAR